MFIVDDSSSVGQPYFDVMKTFISNVVLDLDIESDVVRVGLVTIGDSVRPKFDLGQYRTREDVLAAVSRVTYSSGAKNTSDAIRYVRTRLLASDRSAATKIGRLLSLY